jgi:hypothetical protein
LHDKAFVNCFSDDRQILLNELFASSHC